MFEVNKQNSIQASIKTILLLMMGMQLVVIGFGQDGRGVGVRPTQTTEKRLALVIGNGAYQNTTPLTNPPNDATDMAATLKELGFEVIAGTNQNKQQMENLIRQFGNRLRDSKGVGLVFYAGHGIQADGANYLIPVDADIKDEDEVANFSVNLSFLLGKMNSAGNGFNIVILDACRNNPFARSWRNYRDIGDKGGLAKVDAPTGTLIAYATKPGATASDGDGKNGLYTSVLLKQMRLKNVDVTKMLQNVRAEVLKLSGNQQVPFDESSLVGDFYFAGTTTAAANNTNNNTVPNEKPLVAKDSVAVEREAWSYIKESTDPQDFRSFLTDFPNGANAGNAKIKLEQAVWEAVRNSGDKGKLQGYLNEFPNGVNAPLAKIRIRQLDAASTTNSNSSPSTTPINPNLNSGSIAAGTVITNSLRMRFGYSPAGSFQMGSSEDEVDEAVFEAKKYAADAKRDWYTRETLKHKVTIKEGFYMGKYEITQGQWQAVMGDNPSQFPECGANCPVENVSWDDIQVFVKRLSAKDTQFEYRLPTEAEWEYAARAETTTAFAFGDSLNASQANFNGEYPFASTKKGKHIGRTVPVGSYQANAFGLYDMHGNVWEWVQDIYNPSYNDLPVDGSANVSVGDSTKRVRRGGSWNAGGADCRSAVRGGFAPAVRSGDIGFRLVARAK